MLQLAMLTKIQVPIPRRSQELGIPQTTLYCILHKDLVLTAYIVFSQRKNFADWVYFQLNGTTLHTINETIAILQEQFPDRIIF